MWSKITSLILCFSLAYAPICIAENTPIPKGKITGLSKGEHAPYTGVLLDNIAAARVFSDKKYLEEQFNLKLQYELGKQKARLDLTIQSQKASLDSLQEKHTTLMKLKDDEIKRLSDLAASKEDYTTWWTVGGVVVGIGLTIAVVYAVDARTGR
tara:strand:- start:1141 stop:1602 length:462 start_codon:yes stop_codon:yes gene_type:complete